MCSNCRYFQCGSRPHIVFKNLVAANRRYYAKYDSYSYEQDSRVKYYGHQKALPPLHGSFFWQYLFEVWFYFKWIKFCSGSCGDGKYPLLNTINRILDGETSLETSLETTFKPPQPTAGGTTTYTKSTKTGKLRAAFICLTTFK